MLPIYCAITICEVFDGTSTSFWFDRWLSISRLCELFALLHTHTTKGDVSIAQVIEEELDRDLVLRISCMASIELEKMNTLIAQLSLQEGSDWRNCALNGKIGVLRSGKVYNKIMVPTGAPNVLSLSLSGVTILHLAFSSSPGC